MTEERKSRRSGSPPKPIDANPTQESRFWELYYSRTIRAGECLEWTGSYKTSKWGSPTPACWWKEAHNISRLLPVRRVAYSLTIGDPPDNMFIVTTCGNQRCVRLSHLKKVTDDEREAILRNRLSEWYDYDHNAPRGEKSKNAKLNETLVRLIRSRYIQGDTPAKIAPDYGVSTKCIYDVIQGKTWAHVQ